MASRKRNSQASRLWTKRREEAEVMGDRARDLPETCGQRAEEPTKEVVATVDSGGLLGLVCACMCSIGEGLEEGAGCVT